MRPTAASPASAITGRSTTCFRPSRRRAWRAKDKGAFSRAELAPLAKTNVELLKEYDYFTFATADGNKAPLGDPLPDYFADYKDLVVTLHFTLPFKTPVKAKLLKIDIYDATIFVDFSFAKDKPVSLVGTPPAASSTWCRRAR